MSTSRAPWAPGACYIDGRRDDGDDGADGEGGDHEDGAGPAAVRALLRRRGEGLVWIDLDGGDREAFAAVAAELDVHPLAAEDAVTAHQRAKLDEYGDLVFVVLRPARWDGRRHAVDIGELHVLVGPNVVVTVARGTVPDLRAVRAELESRPDRLRLGTLVVLHAVLDAVVDDYAPVVEGLEEAVDRLEDEVFGGEAGVAKRIYRLMRQVVEVDRATEPLPEMLESAQGLAGDLELEREFADILDHTKRIAERVDAFRTLLRHALEVNSILVTEQGADEARRLTEASLAQGDQVKRISAWAAILFAPTLVASIYGMNFDVMPELRWLLGYPFALGLMVVVGVVLYVVFRRRGWL